MAGEREREREREREAMFINRLGECVRNAGISVCKKEKKKNILSLRQPEANNTLMREHVSCGIHTVDVVCVLCVRALSWTSLRLLPLSFSPSSFPCPFPSSSLYISHTCSGSLNYSLISLIKKGWVRDREERTERRTY